MSNPQQPLLRRKKVLAAAVAAAVIALVAAGALVVSLTGDDDPADTSTDAPATTTAPAGDAPADRIAIGTPLPVEPGAYPVTIEHHHGSTTIEAEPQRVVTLGLNDQDYVLAFGVQPVASTYWNGAEDDATQVWTDAMVTSEPEVLNMPDGLNFEAIAAADPDLIIGLFLDVDAPTYDLLSAMAPTIVRSAEFDDYGVPWQDTTRAVGAALGRPARAEQLVGDLEARFTAVTAAHPSWAGTSFSLLDFAEGQIGVYRSDEPRPAFFRAFGLEVPAVVDQLAGVDTWGQVSLEQAADFDLDLIMWRVNSAADVEAITSNPVLSALDVMQRGDVVWMDRSTDVGNAYAWGTIVSLPYALDGLVPMLEAALGES